MDEDAYREIMLGLFYKTKKIFVADWSVHFDGSEESRRTLLAQATTKEIITSIGFGTEFVFRKSGLYAAFTYDDNKRVERPLLPSERNQPYIDLPLRHIHGIVVSAKGKHELGGEIPDAFKMPEINCVTPFQFLGIINHDAETFPWLTFPLHLICPVYLNFSQLFIDYTDPLNPVVLNRSEVEAADTSFPDDIAGDSEIIYKKTRFDFQRSSDFRSPGHAGLPEWIQNADIPTCPKSGEAMQFLIQLEGGIKTLRTNVKPKVPEFATYFKTMNFWGDGFLYVFIQPASKVVCYFIQNT